jgi:hypothetical protein
MTDQRYQDEDPPVISGPAPEPEPENQMLVPMSLAATLTKAEIDQQIATAHAFPRSASVARDRMISLATLDDTMAEECIYSVPRGGKQIRGPSIRFAEIVLNSWGNVRCAARVTHEDRIERYVEAEALVHDLESNVGYVARARRRIELKKGRKTVDPDMVQLAGAAAISVARRNAILGAVPKPVWRRAHEAVEAVIKGDVKTLAERRDVAIAYFNRAGITTERVLKALEVNHVDDITLEHFANLNGMRSALKTGESTLDQLFPEERAPGPTPQTLDDKLKTIAAVDPKTGEIRESVIEEALKEAAVTGQAFVKDGQVLKTEEVVAEAPKGGQRGPRGARKASAQERLQAEGDAALAKGRAAFDHWYAELTGDDMGSISVVMADRWRAALRDGG